MPATVHGEIRISAEIDALGRRLAILAAGGHFTAARAVIDELEAEALERAAWLRDSALAEVPLQILGVSPLTVAALQAANLWTVADALGLELAELEAVPRISPRQAGDLADRLRAFLRRRAAAKMG